MPTNVSWNNTTYPIPLAGELNWASLSNFLIDLGNNAGITNVMKQSISVKTTTPVAVSATSDFTIVVDLAVAGPSVVNLPAGVTKQVFVVLDGKGDAATNNITINGNGGQLINGAASYVLNKNEACVILQFDGTEWRVLASFQVSGQITNADVAVGAAIDRSKLASGTADYVVINDGSGVMSEEQRLAKVRGGSGQDNTALTFPASGTIATLADIGTSLYEQIDLINFNITTTAARTRWHHHFTLDVGNTIDVVASSTFVSIGPSINNGTITVNGLMRIV